MVMRKIQHFIIIKSVILLNKEARKHITKALGTVSALHRDLWIYIIINIFLFYFFYFLFLLLFLVGTKNYNTR